MQPGQLKRGAVIEIDGAPCIVENITVQTPSSRGANTIWKVRARNLKTKGKVDAAFRSGDTIGEPNFEKRNVQYLYSDGNRYHFMDLSDYNQFELSGEDLDDAVNYLIDNLEGIKALMLEDEVIGIDMPLVVDLRITECDPAVKGNSATARQKNATVETGYVLQVPEHIAQGELIRVDTTTGKFISRAKA